jgi:hypothetical protein
VIYNLKKTTFRCFIKKFVTRFFNQIKIESLLYCGNLKKGRIKNFKRQGLLLLRPTIKCVGFASKCKVNEDIVKKILIRDLNRRQQQKCCLLFFMEKRIEIGDKLPNFGSLSLISMPISYST